MRILLAACVFGLLAALAATVSAAGPAFEVQRLDPALSSPAAEDVTHGRLDDHFLPASATHSLPRADDYWLRLNLSEPFEPRDVATINVRKGRNVDAELFVMDHGAPVPLRLASHVPGFVGA